MKATRKIMALALVVLLAAALMVPAFADDPSYDITVNGAKAGETYTAYKMLDLVVNEDITKFSYTVNSAWEDFFDGEGADLVTIDDQGYVSVDDDDVAALAQAAAAYAAANNITAAATDTPTGDTASLELTSAGYYLVTSTNGTVAMIDTTPDKQDVEINEKNEDPTIEKDYAEGDANAQIGDTITYTITVSAKKGAKNYVIHDTMSAGLSFNNDIAVKVGDSTIAATNYTVKTTGIASGETFNVVFAQTYLDTITDDTDITVTYTATLVATDDQTNSAKLTWGDEQETEPSDVETTTDQFQLLKYDKDDNGKDPLAGATFSLKRGDDVVNVVAVSGQTNTYRPAIGTETGSATFTTVSTGNITIIGLDDDSTYTLVETAPPAGYNKLAAPVDVTLGETSVVEVANSAGQELPATGGNGTIIFIAVGAVVFLGTALVLVAKKRLYNEG